jgi:ABC-type phosphate transport system substrate-binding protein
MDNVEEAIASANWRFTMNPCAHEYIVLQQQPEHFRAIAAALSASADVETYRGAKYRVIFRGEFKYWRQGSVINRKKETRAEWEKHKDNITF